ncbi:DUF3182 family protein [Bradyrhizobium sp. BRP22]|uniref:DUF3182 family protein n=1 Tax=Bradyrhizobium sp. BRP22 TaxID=2793821 RepID=UPI001CD251BE|nr:DUF3182 family protein [Bradyrhizobium sp. BRP22]MCA1457505.1 DUF3182 family protein [Bradyrhizobium sp. BRP22]
MTNEASSKRTVVVYTPPGTRFCATHERVAHIRIAKRIAALKGGSFGGQFDSASYYPDRPYFLPTDTIVGIDLARELGIFAEDDLFGGVVPHGFIGTKAITHGLTSERASSPANWSPAFATEVCDIVPRGYTAFCIEDARAAMRCLLREGPVRIKPVKATGGRGQSVIRSASEVEAVLEKLDQAQLSRFGLVLEEDLAAPITYSVGQIRLEGLLASYYGVQNLVHDNFGQTAYGGSDLSVVRGDFDDLVRVSDPPGELRTAIAQAQRYDAAARRHFPEIIASRRNYDIICGTSATGGRCSGVLEQSWRIGGATPAEITALEAFAAVPDLKIVEVSSVEAYGTCPPKPANAIIYFEGVDEQIGPITKYAHLRNA